MVQCCAALTNRWLSLVRHTVFGPVLTGAIVLSLLVGPSGAQDVKVGSPERSDLVDQEFEVAKGGDMVFLPIEVSGRVCEFLLDSGMGVTTLDRSFEPTLGAPLRTAPLLTPGSATRTDVFAAPLMSMRRKRLSMVAEVLCADLAPLRDRTGRDCMGVLGVDALKETVVQINFDEGKVRFLRAAPDDSGRPVRVTFINGIPFVRLQPGNSQRVEWFQIDTGATHTGSGELTAEVFGDLIQRGEMRLVGSTSYGLLKGGVREGRDGRLEEFRFDYPARAGGLLAFGFHVHHGLVFSESSRNALGLGYLSRYTLTIDFPNERLYLRPGRYFDGAEWYPFNGIHLMIRGTEVVVESVDTESAAAVGGVVAGDVVVSINSVDVRNRSLPELRRMLGESGRVTLGLRRDGAVVAREVRFGNEKAKLGVKTVGNPPYSGRFSQPLISEKLPGGNARGGGVRAGAELHGIPAKSQRQQIGTGASPR
jgi:hypothetical protein